MSAPVITTRNLSKTYTERVLNNINLDVQPGEIIGYIGPNGAGKSTTIKILTGIIPDFDGDATVLGLDVRKDILEIKRQIGYIPENAALYDTLTPLEYLQFIGQLYNLDSTQIERKAKELLQLFELGNYTDSRMTTFSKGMRQKVLLIAGMIHNPAILFLDEPLSGLDANAVILVKEILAQLKLSGKTIFYSSHIMDVVEKISDRIMVINKGEMIANGTFQELNAQAHSGSLEKLFTELTGNTEHQSTAGQFINILESK
ncbi:MAG: ABC transporter ATP-binding protein [Cyclobacteriaceae bacterium]|nr:ABC transporter ATP-binding protein [Cyclobacteriaceae bacterium]